MTILLVMNLGFAWGAGAPQVIDSDLWQRAWRTLWRNVNDHKDPP